MKLTARATSLQELARLGYRTNANLPEFEISQFRIRSRDIVATRMLALHAIAVAAFDLSRVPVVVDWLRRYSLEQALTDPEATFLQRPRALDAEQLQWRSEACFALCWALKVVDANLVADPEPDDMVFRLPAISRMEDPSVLVQGTELRASGDLIQQLDLLYCAHWAVRQAVLDGQPWSVAVYPQSIPERRRALEWMLCAEDWDRIDLDT